MAGKKSQPRGQKHQRPQQRVSLPDRRAMEGVIHQLLAGVQGHASPDTPLAKAQAICYRAADEADEKRKVQLAHEALELSADCADAYVLLAEHSSNRKEALGLYEQGVAAGERALGPEVFKRSVGHFWGLLETRPYMRARLGLAFALWSGGRRPETVRHLQEMLRLNPGDNQGVRYPLASFLLFLDRDDELGQLLASYNESTACWDYTKALLAFRQQGDTPEARHLLEQARKTNKHVAPFLLGEKALPEELPDYYSPGDESEALHYVRSVLVSWKATAGALAWLRQTAEAKKPKAIPAPKGPLGVIKKWLTKNLPQEYDVWQADFRQLPNWVRIAGEFVRPWAILVTSRSSDLVLAHEMPDGSPSAAALWDALVQALQYPAAGKPHRPTELQVRSDERWDALRPHVDEIGVKLVVVEDVDQLSEAFSDMCGQICGPPRPGLLEMPGITPARAGNFYEAAAFFFRNAPWKIVGDEVAIQVECSTFQSGPWYAVVMGQAGLATGLALYDDLAVLCRLWANDSEEAHRQSVVTTVSFGEKWEIPVADLDAAKKHCWSVARPDAYPVVFHKDRGLSLRAPLAWELELMQACLRAIPEFVARQPWDSPAKEEFTVPTDSGDQRLVLSWALKP